MKIPNGNQRLEQTKERLPKLFDKAIENHSREIGYEVELSPLKNPIREFLIEQLVNACDDTGFFIAYVGD